MGYYEKGKWWVSPSNYEAEVLDKLNFPGKIKFLDTTLRDGEQQPNIILSKEGKPGSASNTALSNSEAEKFEGKS